MIKAEIKVTDFSKDFAYGIKKVLKDKIKQIAVDNSFVKSIEDSIEKRFINSRHYQSLLYGDLRVEFGLENPLESLEEILNVLKSSIVVDFQDAEQIENIKFEVRIDFVPSLVRSGAYLSDGGVVNWLDWLLEAGESIVISDHRMIIGEFPTSRTGKALMEKGGSYSVSSEFAGDDNKNWISEILEGLQEDIFDEIKKRL